MTMMSPLQLMRRISFHVLTIIPLRAAPLPLVEGVFPITRGRVYLPLTQGQVGLPLTIQTLSILLRYATSCLSVHGAMTYVI